MIALIVIKGLLVIAIIIIVCIIIKKKIAAEDIVLEAELRQIARHNKVREEEILEGMRIHEAQHNKLMGTSDWDWRIHPPPLPKPPGPGGGEGGA